MPISLNLLIHSISFVNRSIEDGFSNLSSVTGRLGDIHVNEDGSKTMNEKDQKIIHRWDYGRNRSTWTTQSSKNIAKVLDHLKLGLDDETTPDSLMV
jgi:hypothetical protein